MSLFNPSSQRHSRWLKIAGRLSGLTAVVLGGWSLWLAFSTVKTPEQIEALIERHDETVVESDDLPEVLRPTPHRPRSVALITDVAAIAEEEAPREVESAAFVSTMETSPDAVDVASFSTEEPADSEKDAAATTASAAWLTGEIEDAADESDSAADPLASARPWKRTTKSLKSTVRSPRSAPRR